MVLVQRRGPIFDAVIRALKRAGVPVAGADVLRIGAELAVNDLMAALRFAATPDDDLSLAAFLRSPLGGLSERELFELAHGRPGRLGRALRDAPPDRCPEVRALVDDLRAQADFLRPFELITRMLVRHDGRRRLVARLGPEAEDGIDALLDQALAYESVEPPTLAGFLAWFDRDMVTVKRRSDEGADQVRVMTVHGAKGLEAPIVILPDTAVTQDSWNAPLGAAPRRRAAGLARQAASTARRRSPRPTSAGAGRSALESRRLLYVALTRARQWLIVCGAGVPANGNGSGESWHDLVAAAMAELDPATEPGPLGEARVLDHRWSDGAAAPARRPRRRGAAAGLAARAPAAAARRPRRCSRPRCSAASWRSRAKRSASGPTDALGARHRRAPAARASARPARRPSSAALAARLLPGHPDVAALLDEAARVLAAPGLAAVFEPAGLAEVDVAAPVPGRDDLRIAGRIDRLVVGGAGCSPWTSRATASSPAPPEGVPEGILRQLGAYRAALVPLWPDRPVEVAVLWTRAARLMPVPAALADAAFARALLDLPGVRP